MTTKYLYLDDDSEAAVRPYRDAVQRANDDISITIRRPEEFSADLRAVSQASVDGVILDLRLDLMPSESGKRVDYRASAIAQELRTRASEGAIEDVPVVLWSTQAKLAQSYRRDLTGQDLFDLIYDKDAVAQQPRKVAFELIALADAYQRIRDARESVRDALSLMRHLLALDAERPLDPRVEERFSAKSEPVPPHEYARFIMRELIGTPGPLLEEARVVALLGLDIEQSSDWPALRDTVLSSFRYEGVFADAWQRWWKNAIERWWSSLPGSGRPIRLLAATERVRVLSEATGLVGLKAAAPIQENYSDRFVTICEGLGRPLDPVDGFQVRGPEPEPWQERRYISTVAALERVKYDEGLRVHPLERDRYEELLRQVAGSAKD